LDGLAFYNNKPITLEIRKLDESFPPDITLLNVFVIRLQALTNQLLPPLPLQIDPEITTLEFKQQLIDSKTFEYPLEKIRLIKLDTINATPPIVFQDMIDGKPTKLVSDFNVEEGTVLHVEYCENPNSSSFVIDTYEKEKNMITIRFIKPGKDQKTQGSSIAAHMKTFSAVNSNASSSTLFFFFFV
jgi:hypothetical protein